MSYSTDTLRTLDKFNVHQDSINALYDKLKIEENQLVIVSNPASFGSPSISDGNYVRWQQAVRKQQDTVNAVKAQIASAEKEQIFNANDVITRPEFRDSTTPLTKDTTQNKSLLSGIVDAVSGVVKNPLAWVAGGAVLVGVAAYSSKKKK